MPSRYHPIEDGLWSDDKFDAQAELPDAPFVERAFFAFLCSCERQRPAGIYRATDGQLATDTRLPVKQVHALLYSLDRRGLIVRDGNWVFTVKYFKRLPKQPFLLRAAEKCVSACSSTRILSLFNQVYPMFSQWLPDGCVTVEKPSGEHSNQLLSTEQSRVEQSRVEQIEAVGAEAKNDLASGPPANGLPPWFKSCLETSRNFRPLLLQKHAAFWAAMSTAYDPYQWLKWDEEVSKADAWIEANPQRRPRLLARFLRNWFERAVEHQRKEQHAKTTR